MWWLRDGYGALDSSNCFGWAVCGRDGARADGANPRAAARSPDAAFHDPSADFGHLCAAFAPSISFETSVSSETSGVFGSSVFAGLRAFDAGTIAVLSRSAIDGLPTAAFRRSAEPDVRAAFDRRSRHEVPAIFSRRRMVLFVGHQQTVVCQHRHPCFATIPR